MQQFATQRPQAPRSSVTDAVATLRDASSGMHTVIGVVKRDIMTGCARFQEFPGWVITVMGSYHYHKEHIHFGSQRRESQYLRKWNKISPCSRLEVNHIA